MKKLLLLSLLVTLCGIAQAEGAGKIVKWVDSKGVTHYGDKIPTEQVGKSNTEMSRTGVVVKRNEPAKTVDNAAIEQQSAQEKQDKVLMSSYTNPQEIDAARDRSLQMDQANLGALMQQKESLQARNQRNLKTAESFKASKKPLPAYTTKELQTAKTETANIDKQIAEKKLNMDNTRKKYATEKARFIALKQPATPTLETSKTELNGSEMPKNSSAQAAVN